VVGFVGAQVKSVTNGIVYLTKLKSTQFVSLDRSASLPTSTERSVTKFSALSESSFQPAFNEVDTVGCVLSIRQNGKFDVGRSSAVDTGRFVPVLLGDETGFCEVLVWGADLTKPGLKEALRVGQIVALRDLDWRSQEPHKRNGLLNGQLYVRDYTTVTNNPRQVKLATALQELRKFVENNPETLDKRRRDWCAQQEKNHTPVSSSDNVVSTPRRQHSPVVHSSKSAWNLDTARQCRPYNEVHASSGGSSLTNTHNRTPLSAATSTDRRVAWLSAYTDRLAATSPTVGSLYTPTATPSPLHVGRLSVSRLVQAPYRVPTTTPSPTATPTISTGRVQARPTRLPVGAIDKKVVSVTTETNK